MQKYLKDARNDGEVTSSTNVKLVKMEVCWTYILVLLDKDKL